MSGDVQECPSVCQSNKLHKSQTRSYKLKQQRQHHCLHDQQLECEHQLYWSSSNLHRNKIDASCALCPVLVQLLQCCENACNHKFLRHCKWQDNPLCGEKKQQKSTLLGNITCPGVSTPRNGPVAQRWYTKKATSIKLVYLQTGQLCSLPASRWLLCKSVFKLPFMRATHTVPFLTTVPHSHSAECIDITQNS